MNKVTAEEILLELQMLSSFEKPLDSKYFFNKYRIDKRSLTFLVEEIREKRTDVVVGSNTRGYYIVKNQSEAEYYQHFIRDRALKVLQRYNKEKKIIQKLFFSKAEQISMELK
jgi:hypothetical protein